MTIIPHRLVKTLAFAIVIAAIIASTGLVPALDATGGTASAEASTPASTAEDGLQPQSQSQPRSVVIGPAETAPGAMTSQKTLRERAVTSVEIAPPQAIPTQPNPSQPVFTITNTDTQSVTVWITHEGVETKADTDAAAEPGSEPTPADLQYRDAETGERLSGADVTVTLKPGEERVVGVVADAGASASNATAGVASSAITTTTTATANVYIRHSRAGGAR
ncbi:MAG: hypothetical protein J07HQW1_02273 [Haloquadratum walsbyi J07HQW1]|uniref:Uncharacterized protein n=1 Tax=Haloquadratum walsbyi J07HQW1 TaxID=1238424 RepID=U1N6Z2_9EURY|nr:MAG: hypothetical protein J07HQW1_02273 [Haloquadratum walsbyi J07HQW1]